MTRMRNWLVAALLVVPLLLAGPVRAQETVAREAILIDVTTGQELFARNADQPMAPSSLAKLMTAYILFEELAAGRMNLDDRLLVSEKAWRMRGSRMFVEVGHEVPVEDLLRGVVINSGNDASVVIAESISGTEENFAGRMNETALRLGMTGSHFTTATGWPDPDQYSTARDIAILAIRIIEDFPEYYGYYSETSYGWGEVDPQNNRNPLLYRDIGADGLKTGYTDDGGYGLAASAVQEGRRLVMVVNGIDSARARSSESERLMTWGFRSFENVALFAVGEMVAEAEVWLGEQATVPLVPETDLVAVLPRGVRTDMQVVVRYGGPLQAPVVAGQPAAELVVTAPGIEPWVVTLVAGTDVAETGFVGRIATAVRQMIGGLLP